MKCINCVNLMVMCGKEPGHFCEYLGIEIEDPIKDECECMPRKSENE